MRVGFDYIGATNRLIDAFGNPDLVRELPLTGPITYRHLFEMRDRMRSFVDRTSVEYDREKCADWFGWMKGVFVAHAHDADVGLEVVKEITRQFDPTKNPRPLHPIQAITDGDQ